MPLVNISYELVLINLAAEVCDPTSQSTNSSDVQDCSNSYFGPPFVFPQISQINVATSLR